MNINAECFCVGELYPPFEGDFHPRRIHFRFSFLFLSTSNVLSSLLYLLEDAHAPGTKCCYKSLCIFTSMRRNRPRKRSHRDVPDAANRWANTPDRPLPRAYFAPETRYWFCLLSAAVMLMSGSSRHALKARVPPRERKDAPSTYGRLKISPVRAYETRDVEPQEHRYYFTGGAIRSE
jgi:hypothetical protein